MSGSGGVSVRAGPSPRLEGRAHLRRMQRRALHKGQAIAADPLDPDEAGFTCAVVCGTCGHLEWPDHRDSPHRRDAEANASDLPACSNCNDRAWIDLAPESTAFELRKSESASLSLFRSRYFHLGSSAVVGVWLGGWLGASVGKVWPGLGLLVGLIVAVTTTLGLYWVEKRALGEAPVLPSRWTMALPPAKLSDETVRGVARAKADLLTSPITGRPCVAYEVAIRDNRDPDAHLRSWTLIEQRVIDLHVDDREFEGSTLHLELSRQYLGAQEDLELEDAARIFLRQRGFGRTTPAPHLYETIVPPDAEIEIQKSATGGVLRLGPKAVGASTPTAMLEAAAGEDSNEATAASGR